jgi:hypothetical protein
MAEEKENIWQRIQDIDRRIIWFFMVAIAVYVFNNPIGLPLEITPYVQNFYDYMEDLPPNSVLLICGDYGPVNELNIGTQYTPLIQHLTRLNQEKNIRWVFFGIREDVVTMFPVKLEEPKVKAALDTLTYGEDWAFIGFISGRETGMAALCKGIKELLTVDYYGNDLNDLPLLDDVNEITDFAACIGSGGTDLLVFVRQFSATYGVDTLIMTQAIVGPSIEPYIPESVVSMLVDIKSAAEYELLVKSPGTAIAGMDLQTAVHIYFFFLIALGNIAWFISRPKTGRRL